MKKYEIIERIERNDGILFFKIKLIKLFKKVAHAKYLFFDIFKDMMFTNIFQYFNI